MDAAPPSEGDLDIGEFDFDLGGDESGGQDVGKGQDEGPLLRRSPPSSTPAATSGFRPRSHHGVEQHPTAPEPKAGFEVLWVVGFVL